MATNKKMIKEVSSQQELAEKLLYVTVRLEGTTNNGASVGTGFFYLTNNRIYVVTNKHVVDGVIEGSFNIIEGKNAPILGSSVEFFFSQQDFIGHPDPKVDVAVIDITKQINDSFVDSVPVFFKTVQDNIFPTDKDINKYVGPIEEIVFIGYPSGIWDTKNYLPIVRRGITATPYNIDFEGTKRFLIDASVFPGSSGSPVFIIKTGRFADKKGKEYTGDKLLFLGIVASVYQRSEQGEIHIVDIPTSKRPVAAFNQMIDLGVVFKSETIRETILNLTHTPS